ncbi:MAG: hypothetical protein WAZ18_00100 [Alphaproteobacteria bacterium]
MTPIRWCHHFSNASFAIFLAVTVTLYAVLANYGLVPDVSNLVTNLQALFATYGRWALFGAAFLEGLFMVSLYFPGSMVVFAAVMFTEKTLPSLALLTATCWVAFMAAGFINYAMGHYGFYKIFNALGARSMLANTRTFMERRGAWAFVLTSFHPNYLAIVQVCAGMGNYGVARSMALSGAGMAISGPLLVAASAALMDGIMSEQGSHTMTALFIASFTLWAVAIVGKGVYADIRHSYS